MGVYPQALSTVGMNHIRVIDATLGLLSDPDHRHRMVSSSPVIMKPNAIA